MLEVLGNILIHIVAYVMAAGVFIFVLIFIYGCIEALVDAFRGKDSGGQIPREIRRIMRGW